MEQQLEKNKTAETSAKKGKGLLMFLKASVSSQIASWIDMGLSFLLFAFVIPDAFVAKAIGAATGGVVNCSINYKWTFRPEGCSKRYVAIKYAIVWFGSLMLNSFGTDIVTSLLSGLTFLADWGVTDNGCFMAAQLSVSLIVSICWNFLLQRYFVFRNVPIKDSIRKCINKN